MGDSEMFIYLIVNHETGKYYVGQHKGKDLRKYLQVKLSQSQYELKRKGHGRGSYLFASMRKHPRKAWSIHSLRSDIQTREELDSVERDFIKFLRSQDPEYGYNICRGGEGFTGSHSPESCQKASESLRKAFNDPATHNRMVKGLRKGWNDPETRLKLAEANKVRLLDPHEHIKAVEAARRLHTPEIQAKSAEARKGIWDDPEMRAKAAEMGKKGWSGENYARTLEAVRKTNSSPEYRANMSKIKKGRKFGPEFCSKMSEVAKKREAKKRETRKAQIPSIAALK